MDPQFWRDAWKEGRIGFHQGSYNDKLVKYFAEFSFTTSQKVLVPLCGKSKDMIWLRDQGLKVTGVELSEKAVEEFLHSHSQENITLICGDFFRFQEPESFDYVYDRAALVALPYEMREEYVKVIYRSLKPGGKILLITYQYHANELQGPPFSISDEEIERLFRKNFTIELYESERPQVENNRLDAAPSLRQNVYLISKPERTG